MGTESVKIEFTDVFSGQQCTVTCGRILRQMRGKRIVYEGRCGQTEAIVKLFMSHLHARRHWMREKNGLNELAKREVRAPGILSGGKMANGRYLLVLEKISNAADLFNLAENKSADLPAAANKLFIYLAGMHKAGVVQKDLHLGNFLWDGQEVYALDPAMMTFSSRPLNKNKSLRQLAKLFVNFVHLQTRKQLIVNYCNARKWVLNDNEYQSIENLSQKYRLKFVEAGLSKTLRDSKRFLKARAGALTGIFDKKVFAGQDVKQLMLKLDAAMESGTILKRGNTCLVSKIKMNGHDAVVKCYNHKGLFHSLRHTIKGSRAKKCWLFGQRLAGLDIACAKPLAFIEQRRLGLIWQSYIVNEFVEGKDIGKYCADLSEHQKQEITAKTIDLLDSLVKNKMTHGDLKPSNILVNNGHPFLIDLDSMRRHNLNSLMKIYADKMSKSFNSKLQSSLQPDLTKVNQGML